MPRTVHLTNMTTPGLHEQREASLRLTTDAYAGTASVIEYHADEADRISDEIDRRNNT